MAEETNKPEAQYRSTFEIDSLVAEVYNEIAGWHNDEPSKESLKQLSLEIVEKIANATLQHVGLVGNLSICDDEETKKKVEELKRKEDTGS